MTDGLFGSASLRLECGDRFEAVDAQSGTWLGALNEVSRVRSPRGTIFKVDPVATPRITFALSGPDGAPLLYVDRAEHLKLYPLPPQTAVLGPDGTMLCRVDYENHSPMNGGGRVQRDEAGVEFVPAARLLDAENRPLADMLMVVLPWDDEKPKLPDGQDARLARWVNAEGTILAERRDGVLHFADGLPGAWRAMVIGAFLSLTLEYHLPFGKAKASKSVPEAFPGHAVVHSVYDEYQLRRVGLWKRPVEVTSGDVVVFRAGVRTYQLEGYARVVGPIMVVLAVINLFTGFLN